MRISDLRDPTPPDPELFRRAVAERASRRRAWRRGVISTAAVAIVVIGLAVGEVAADRDRRSPTARVASGTHDSTTTTMTSQASTSTSTPVASPVEPQRPTTTEPPEPTTTTTVQCPAEAWSVRSTADKPLYRKGDLVVVEVVATNTSSRTCSSLPPVSRYMVLDSTGRDVSWADITSEPPPGGGAGDPGVRPGDARRWRVEWDQRGCLRTSSDGDCEGWGEVDAGTYEIRIEWVLEVPAVHVELTRNG